MDRDNATIAERLSTGVTALLGANVVAMGADALLVLLLTRVFLEPAMFGQLFFVLSILGVVSLFATLGLPKSAARYVTEYMEKDDAQVRFIIRRTLLFLVVPVCVVAVALVVSSDLLARLLGEPGVAPLLFFGAAYIVCYSGSNYFSTLFQGFNRVKWSAVVSVVSSVGRLSFAVGFLLFGFGVLGALAGYVAGYALSMTVGGVILYRQFYARLQSTDQPEDGLSRRILEYSVPLTATKGAGVLDKRVDTILVGTLLNTTAVGFYVIAKQISDVVVVPASSFGYAISPTYGEQKASDRVDYAATIYEEALTYTLLFYLPVCVGMVLVAEPLVQLVFGAQYLNAVPAVQVFAGFVLVNAVNKITTDGLDYLGRARSRAIVKSAMAVSNFLLNLLLIPILGVVGAAIATVVTMTGYTLGNMYFIHEELGFRVRHIVRNVAVISIIALGMASSVVAVLPYISGLPSLLAVVVFGGGVWVVLSVVSGMLDVRQVASLVF